MPLSRLQRNATRQQKTSLLTPRWTNLKVHPIQQQYFACQSRFIAVPAGRRSGKTEIAKRKLAHKALTFSDASDGWFVCSAPTFAQAKKIYWEDMKKLIPPLYVVGRPSESDLTIKLFNGSKIQVVGMDKPERAEGAPLDGIIMDEYANMKKKAWTDHVRPALSTVGRPGFAWLIGVPEGRNHYYDVCERARLGATDWSYFHWKSSDILPQSEIDAAREELDELTFLQEYEGSFVTFAGRAYYCFDSMLNSEAHLFENYYEPKRKLDISFDFNVDPGVACITQEVSYKGINPDVAPRITAAMGEVYVPQNSNTEVVCRKILQDWGDHKGVVQVYGDASGGNRGTAQTRGSDWDIIDDILGKHFGQRYDNEVPRSNPSIRGRVNAMNTRLKTSSGARRFLADRGRCKYLIKDLDGVSILEGSAGEIDKKKDRTLTHISDALGYKIAQDFPIEGAHKTSVQLL